MTTASPPEALALREERIHVVHDCGQDIPEGTVGFRIPPGDFPARAIGRPDPAQRPPIPPGVDLTACLRDPNVVSRQQAWLERFEGVLRLRGGTGDVPTWVRRSGSARAVRVPPNGYEALQHRDTVIFGQPNGARVCLRFDL